MRTESYALDRMSRVWDGAAWSAPTCLVRDRPDWDGWAVRVGDPRRQATRLRRVSLAVAWRRCGYCGNYWSRFAPCGCDGYGG